MSYIALYRKYRPSKFADIVGQDVIVKILKNSIINNRIGHAYLFSGPRGTGKTTIAKIFSKAINCESPIDGEACEKCETCKKLLSNDIDIIEIDAASNNGVDEIREIRNNAKLMPSFAKYKVYIIDEVHMLSTGAFNALLKTLEEPPEHVVFILATTEAHKIPLTIISRCQRFDFKKIALPSLKERLEHICKSESKNINSDVLDLISQLSDGGMRDAINLLDQISIITDKEVTKEDIYLISGEVDNGVVEQVFDCVVNSNLSSGLNLIDELYKSGKNLYAVADKLLLLVRDIIINNNIHDYFNKDYSSILNKYSNIDTNTCKNITKSLIDLANELKKATNQKIVFEIYFINLCNLFSDKNNVIEEKPTKELKTQVVNETIQELKDIRINNVLAEADKNILLENIKKYNDIEEYISNKTYNSIAKLLLKGKIVVASKEYMLITLNKENLINIFYNNLISIEELIEKVYKKKYNIVAITDSEWSILKEEYIKNKKSGKKYTKIKESKSLIKNIKTESSDIEDTAIDIFGEEKVTVK